MRLRLPPLALLLFAPLGAGGQPAPPADPTALLPKIPGYELKVLEQRKPIRFEVGGKWVEASLPVFLYCPADPESRSRAVRLLRQAYGDGLRLGREPEWTAAEFQRLLAEIDAALALLERGP